MAGAKEIRSQIGSIRNTQKITKAMQMVAASKMRRAQNKMETSRPYAKRMFQVVGHLANASSQFRSAYLQERDNKRIGVIVISSDRGLCGGLNNNLFRALVKQMYQWKEKDGSKMDFGLIGSKSMHFFRAYGGNVITAINQLGDHVGVNELVGTVKVMLDAYNEGKIDRLYITYNQFVNTITQKPIIEQLLPLVAEKDEKLKHHWDYIYEPESNVLMENLVVRYLESQVYQAVVENNASEQAARMVAMRSATDNAANLIDQLQLVYNKARQAAITQEIAEIVSGAAAV